MNIRYASVCDGIGAAHAAWHPLGWTCAWTSEIEKFPMAVVDHHWKLPNLGDMTKITEADLERHGRIDLLVGGTPCQSFSVAGLRGGMADPRGNLALRFAQLAGALRPRWLVWENVPGVLSSNGGKDFGSILGAMGELGYGFAYRILDAQYFGVAQRRRRVFVVGYLGDWRRAAAVLFERESLRGNPAPSREKGKGVAPTISARVKGGGGLSTDFDCDGGLIHAPNISPALKSRDHKGPSSDGDGDGAPLIAHTLTQRYGAIEDGTGRGTPLVPVAFDSNGTDAQAGSVTPTMRAMNHAASHANAGGQIAIAFGAQNSHHQGISASEHFTPTLDKSKTPAVAIAMAVRRFTPRECERLQGFDDDYTLVTHRNKPAADGPRYKALGNSMAVPVMAWIGKRIELVESIK